MRIFCRDETKHLEGENEIPELRGSYKYLGLLQTEKDLAENYPNIESKLLTNARQIMSSKLTTFQKRRLRNSSTIPAAVYIFGNLQPTNSVQTTLKKCRELDLQIRKIMVAWRPDLHPTRGFTYQTTWGAWDFNQSKPRQRYNLSDATPTISTTKKCRTHTNCTAN